jgi:hypothetical protein
MAHPANGESRWDYRSLCERSRPAFFALPEAVLDGCAFAGAPDDAFAGVLGDGAFAELLGRTRMMAIMPLSSCPRM